MPFIEGSTWGIQARDSIQQEGGRLQYGIFPIPHGGYYPHTFFLSRLDIEGRGPIHCFFPTLRSPSQSPLLAYDTQYAIAVYGLRALWVRSTGMLPSWSCRVNLFVVNISFASVRRHSYQDNQERERREQRSPQYLSASVVPFVRFYRERERIAERKKTNRGRRLNNTLKRQRSGVYILAGRDSSPVIWLSWRMGLQTRHVAVGSGEPTYSKGSCETAVVPRQEKIRPKARSCVLRRI